MPATCWLSRNSLLAHWVVALWSARTCSCCFVQGCLRCAVVAVDARRQHGRTIRIKTKRPAKSKSEKKKKRETNIGEKKGRKKQATNRTKIETWSKKSPNWKRCLKNEETVDGTEIGQNDKKITDERKENQEEASSKEEGKGSPARNRRRPCSTGSSDRPGRCQRSPLWIKDNSKKAHDVIVMVVVVAVAVVAVDLIVVVAAAGFVHHAPLVRCSNLDCSKTKRTPIPIDSSPESSRRNVFKADLFGTGTIPTVEISSMEKNRPREKICPGVCGGNRRRTRVLSWSLSLPLLLPLLQQVKKRQSRY